MTSSDEPHRPRVLFLTSVAFNRVSGGGITFGNLFRGWPKERLMTAHCDTVPADTDVCDQYYLLSRAELTLPRVLQRFVPPPGADPATAAGAPRVGKDWRRSVLRLGKQVIFGDMLPDRGVLSPGLQQWIEATGPQVIYTILGSNAMMDLTLAIHRKYRIPVVFHIMDDWLAAAYRGGMLAPHARRRMHRLFRELVDVAAFRMGICDAMCEAYQERYGRPFIAFQNAVDVPRWSRNAPDVTPRDGERELLYSGSILSFAQLDSLIDCCNAVIRLNQGGYPVRLSIYSPAQDLARHGGQLPRAACITVQPAIRDDAALFESFQRADALLLPVNFDAESVRFIRYSMPTKVPAYLAAGTPVLAYGPAQVAQIRYAQTGQWACAVTARDGDQLQDAMRRILDDGDYRAQLQTRALDCARLRHDSAQVRSRFQWQLSQAVARTSQ